MGIFDYGFDSREKKRKPRKNLFDSWELIFILALLVCAAPVLAVKKITGISGTMLLILAIIGAVIVYGIWFV